MPPRKANKNQKGGEEDTQGGGEAGRAAGCRFNFAKDKQLIAEVKDVNPFGALNPTKVWDVITVNMNTQFKVSGSNRTYSERTKKLIQKCKAEETASLKRSGAEEDFTDFCSQLLEVVQLYDDAAKQKQKTDTLSERQAGLDARNEGMEEIQANNDVNGGDVDNGDKAEPDSAEGQAGGAAGRGESANGHVAPVDGLGDVAQGTSSSNGTNTSAAPTAPSTPSAAAGQGPSPVAPSSGTKRPGDANGRNEGVTQSKNKRGEVLSYLQKKLGRDGVQEQGNWCEGNGNAEPEG